MYPKTMKALVLEKAFTLVDAEIEVPALSPGSALIRTETVAICGSDIHAFKGNSLLLTYPRILGHELCGSVVEVMPGETGSPVKPGDKVSVLPYFSCGKCYACSLGRENCCDSLKVMGVHVEGGLSEYMVVPLLFLIPVSSYLDPAVVALVEPLAVGAHAVRRGQVKSGDRVFIIGAGPIGLAAAENSRAIGAEVIMADVSYERSAFVRDNFGYEILDPSQNDAAMARLKEWTAGVMPNVVIDSTGVKASMSGAVNYLSQAGSIVFVGLQSGTVDISDPAIHVREATLYASRVAQKRDFLDVLDRIDAGKIDVGKQITHRAPFASAREAVISWIDRGCAVFKGLVTF